MKKSSSNEESKKSSTEEYFQPRIEHLVEVERPSFGRKVLDEEETQKIEYLEPLENKMDE